MEDVPVGCALIVFFQTFSGALFISVGQNVFQTQLLASIVKNLPNIDPSTVIATGATNLHATFSAEEIPKILVAYNSGIVHTFYAAIAMACIGFIGAFGMEWVSVCLSSCESQVAGLIIIGYRSRAKKLMLWQQHNDLYVDV